MIFERPELLALGPLVAILFAFTIGAHWRRLQRLATAYELNALRRLLPTNPRRFPTQRFLCLVGAGALLGLAAAGRTRRVRELAWLVYPMLALAGCRLLFVDLRVGRGITLFPTFILFGIALLLTPRLMRQNREK